MKLVALAIGAVFAAVVGYLVAQFELAVDFSIYSFVLFFIVPVGAIAVGFASAYGYYFSLTRLNVPSRGGDLLAILIVSLVSYFTIHFTYYSEFVPPDYRSLDNFIEFVRLTIETSEVSLFDDKGSTLGGSELGSWGYAYEALLIIGFMIGGFLLSILLKGESYCRSCGRYRADGGEESRYTDDAMQIPVWWQNMLCQPDAAGQRSAFSGLFANAAPGERDIAAMRVKTFVCPKCRSEEHRYSVVEKNGDDWNENGAFAHTAVTAAR